ncbi:MAG: glycosyltransferase family 39 protein [Candidatus Sumerlaeia bacterium]|nr:glycosyltransferase family 39 protein [Candidatus Sumerlaeia bacterium]
METHSLRHFFNRLLPGPPLGEREGRCILGILTVGFLLRWVWWMRYPVDVLQGDAWRYSARAMDLLQWGQFGFPNPTAYEPPGYSVFLYIIYALFGSENFQAVFEIQSALSLLTLLLIYAVIRVHLGVKTAMIALGLMACFPTLVVFSTLIMSEGLALFFFSVYLYFQTRFSGCEKLRVLGGIPLGLAALTREIFLAFIAVKLLWVVSVAIAGRTPRPLRVALPMVMAVMVILPWSVRNHTVIGSFVPVSTNASENLYFGNNPDYIGFRLDRPYSNLDERTQYILLRADAVDYIVEDPVAFVGRMPGKLRRLANPFPYEITWSAFITRISTTSEINRLARVFLLVHSMVLLGFLLVFALPCRKLLLEVPDWPMVLIVTLLVTVVTFGDPRFRFMYEPFMLMGCALILARLPPWNKKAGAENSVPAV